MSVPLMIELFPINQIEFSKKYSRIYRAYSLEIISENIGQNSGDRGIIL